MTAPRKKPAKRRSVSMWACSFIHNEIQRPWALCYPTKSALLGARKQMQAEYQLGPIVKVEVPLW